jgi:hypothetical protein
MSTAIGVILFVVGIGALIASVVLDRRPPRATTRPEPAAHAPATEEPSEVASEEAEPEVALDAGPGTGPEVEAAPASTPAAALEPTPTAPRSEPSEAADAAADRAAAAEARLAKLRAELAGGSAPGVAGTAMVTPEPQVEAVPERVEPGPEAGETDRGREAGRVFAAVASVGREPEPQVEPEPRRPAVVAPAPDEAGTAHEAPALDEAPAPEVVAEDAEAPAATEAGTDHTHALPIVNHSDLVMHIRRQHPGLDTGGSTIQMRVIHERAHGAA